MTSLAAAAALVSLEPLAVVIAAWLAFREVPTRRQWLGLALAMAGAAVVARSAGRGEQRLAGDALVLVAVVLFGVYIAFARGLRQRVTQKWEVPMRSRPAAAHRRARTTHRLPLTTHLPPLTTPLLPLKTHLPPLARRERPRLPRLRSLVRLPS